jgi:hypothetical protein
MCEITDFKCFEAMKYIAGAGFAYLFVATVILGISLYFLGSSKSGFISSLFKVFSVVLSILALYYCQDIIGQVTDYVAIHIPSPNLLSLNTIRDSSILAIYFILASIISLVLGLLTKGYKVKEK